MPSFSITSISRKTPPVAFFSSGDWCLTHSAFVLIYLFRIVKARELYIISINHFCWQLLHISCPWYSKTWVLKVFFHDSVISWVSDLALWPVPAVRQESWWLNCTCFVSTNAFPLLSLLIIRVMIKLCRTKIPHLCLFCSKLSDSRKSFLTFLVTFIMQVIKQVLTICSLCGSLCLLNILGLTA